MSWKRKDMDKWKVREKYKNRSMIYNSIPICKVYESSHTHKGQCNKAPIRIHLSLYESLHSTKIKSLGAIKTKNIDSKKK